MLMKAFLIGSLAIIVATPAYGGVSATSVSTKKFAPSVRLNYTAMGRGAGMAGTFHGGSGWHGGNFHGGWGGRYGYGWRYPYWGGYWGYPYAAAFAFGFGIPLAYYAGYYSAYPAYYPYYGYYGGYAAPGYYYRVARTSSHSRRSSSGYSLVSNVQSSLKNRGYYTGGIDGNFGPESQHALTAFQTASGLPATGTLDTPSLSALGIGIKQSATATAAKHPAAAPTRTPTTEGTFVAPPVAPPASPPAVQSEPTPAPTEGPAEAPVEPPPLQTQPTQ